MCLFLFFCLYVVVFCCFFKSVCVWQMKVNAGRQTILYYQHLQVNFTPKL